MTRHPVIIDAFRAKFLKDYVNPDCGHEYKEGDVSYITVLEFEKLKNSDIVEHHKDTDL